MPSLANLGALIANMNSKFANFIILEKLKYSAFSQGDE